MIKALLASAALLAVATAAHATNLIADGDFDAPSGGSVFTEYDAGSSFGPWSVGSGSVDLIGAYWQEPAGTTGSVDLSGSDPGSISQSFATTAGKTYDLSFDLAGNPDSGETPDPTLKTATLSVGSLASPLSYLEDGQTRDAMGYVPEELQFTAMSTSTTLTFTGTNPGPYGIVIGDVSVSAAPEPSAWVLMIAGIGLVGASLRLTRRGAVVSV